MDPSARSHRSSPVTILPVIISALSLNAGITWAEQAATKSDFEEAQVGSVPPGFSPGLTGKGAPPAWKVVDDPTAPAGPQVVAETSGDRINDRFPLLVLDGFDARDVRVSVAFKPVSGRIDQAAGIVVRLKDANNYYITRANALEGNVRLYKVAGGKRSQFAGKDIDVPSSKWQTLSLEVQGDRLEVRFNGKVLFEARDQTFKDAGKVGLWTKADSVTYFDDLRAEALP
jgi:hypothetical protein